MSNLSYLDIREAIRTRIKAGEWELGELIPGEVTFAEHYGCSRTTVNRALQALADEGIVVRKRKGGTRVRPLPLPAAQLTIPVLREQVESSGSRYDHRILVRDTADGPQDVLDRMRLGAQRRLIRVHSLHLADDRPFALEWRWVNPAAVPTFADADLSLLSANEWLVRTVPFSKGDVALSASRAGAEQARVLGVSMGDPLFTMQRTTWLDGKAVTSMTLFYPEWYKLEFTL